MLNRILSFFSKLPRRMKIASWAMSIFVILFVLDIDFGKIGPTIDILIIALPLAAVFWLVGRFVVMPVLRKLAKPFTILGARIAARIAG